MTLAPVLPGFYFDEEKKKYFKIQPHHIAPSNAKHAQSNVTREEQIAKKRKVEDRHKSLLQQQTVIPAPVLRHSLLGGSGLRREHGHPSIASSLTERDDAFLAGLEPGRRTRHGKLVLDAHRTGDRITVVHHNEVISCDWKKNEAPRNVSLPIQIHHDWVSISMTTMSDQSFLLACSNGPRYHNAFFMRIDDPLPPVFIQGIPDVFVDCAVSDTTVLAFAGRKGIYTATSLGGMMSSTDLGQGRSSCAIEWMSNYTLAYSTCKSRDKRPSRNTVMLWDVRSRIAVIPRIVRPKRITGISKPDSSGNNMIVTSNYEISWYDLRMLRADRPVLSIPHVSGGPRTYHSTYNRSMLAAVDNLQQVQVYSWRTGQHVKTLSMPWAHHDAVRNVRWYESSSGPFLQACHKDEVATWDMGV